MEQNIEKKEGKINLTEEQEKDRSHEENFKLLSAQEMTILKGLLNKIWGVTEILQNDVGFLKKLYTTPKGPKKQDMNREDRKALLKHKLLTRKRKLD